MFCLKGKEAKIDFAVLSSFLDKGGHSLLVIYSKSGKKGSLLIERRYSHQRFVYYKGGMLLLPSVKKDGGK